MFLARVIGTVVATSKVPGLEGAKLLLVQPLSSEGAPRGAPRGGGGPAPPAPAAHVVCVDKREATLAMPDPFVPVDAAIVGFVDQVDHRGLGA